MFDSVNELWKKHIEKVYIFHMKRASKSSGN